MPLIVFLFLSQKLVKKDLKIRELIFEKSEKVINNNPTLVILSLIFITFIFFEFFSINFSFSNHVLDYSEDGNYLTPAQNYSSTKNFWISSHLTHGVSDIVYPILMWKIFGVESIGATRTFSIFLILFLKLLCVLLSYQLTKISNLKRNTKILFFTIFTAILISLSRYTFHRAGYYFSHRDIYIVLFLIFFIELFIQSKFKSLSIILICLIATISILFHVDTGTYLNFILIFYCFYLLTIKKYNYIALIFFSLAIFWSITISLIGIDEFKAFVDNIKTMIFIIDSTHGIKYPTPFFSMINNSDGARATRGLILQLTAGLFILNYLISNKRKIFSSQKIFFAFLFLLSFIMYKNALGRSDAGHIRMSNDLPILINYLFILNYLLIYFENKNFIKKLPSHKTFFSISITFLLFYYISNHHNYKIDNIINYKKNFSNYINLEDKIFLDQKTIKFIRYYEQISEKDKCVENITYDDTMPYLLKKPSCTKYWASLLASSMAMQKDYINQLRKIQPEYIIYFSTDLQFDGMGIYERIELVNSYVLSNYKKHKEFDNYIILKKDR